jgi:hypothetical protein
MRRRDRSRIPPDTSEVVIGSGPEARARLTYNSIRSRRGTGVMTTTTRKLTLLRLVLPCTAMALLTACGGGGGPVVTYTVSATAGSGGSVSPASATVNAGSTTAFTVCHRPAYWSRVVIGMWEPAEDRRNGAMA